ncbi:hypothetical protein [Rhizobium sp. RHZ01]|uniref:hypothetical protein n=1 Tax=Rhizobium sp. RHZ01 TaxID=2769304 RepID=UPI001FEF4309|nr:hypothetical protein [Rhizobium sp. RHZ01]
MDRHELSELLGCEQRVAYEVLRITLHTVRDRLSVDDNAKVGKDLHRCFAASTWRHGTR